MRCSGRWLMLSAHKYMKFDCLTCGAILYRKQVLDQLDPWYDPMQKLLYSYVPYILMTLILLLIFICPKQALYKRKRILLAQDRPASTYLVV